MRHGSCQLRETATLLDELAPVIMRPAPLLDQLAPCDKETDAVIMRPAPVHLLTRFGDLTWIRALIATGNALQPVQQRRTVPARPFAGTTLRQQRCARLSLSQVLLTSYCPSLTNQSQGNGLHTSFSNFVNLGQRFGKNAWRSFVDWQPGQALMRLGRSIGCATSRAEPPNQALHTDRGRIFVSRDTTPLQRDEKGTGRKGDGHVYH
jgi:hypothetical protein